ncbi:MAG: restriction endonuclease [Candidatus Helarchaeota archaeon]
MYVEVSYHNIEFKWIVECKAWKNNVPKEKAMELISILQDIGADRGFFLFPYHTTLLQSCGIGIITSISGQKNIC